MKRTFVIVAVGCVLAALLASAAEPQFSDPGIKAPAVTLAADTNSTPVFSGPLSDWISFMGTEGITNWMVFAGAEYGLDSKKAGGCIGVGYKLSDFVVPVMRFDYVDDKAWTVSGNFQLQVPIKLLGKVTAIPFIFGGAGTPFSGAGDDNGSLVGIAGAGLAVQISSRFDFVTDFEYWSRGGNQLRGGLLFKF